MDFDVRALELVARDQGVDVGDVIAVVETALTEAYRKGGGEHPNATARLRSGHIEIVAGDGTVVTPPGFGTRGAAAARQAIVAWVRDVDRLRKVGPWAAREGTAVRGTVRGGGRAGETRLSVDGVEAVMPAGEAVLNEALHAGQVVDVLVLAANATDRGTTRLTVSRRQPALVTALLTQAAPAVRSGKVAIVAVAREPGVRTKVAFAGPRDQLLGESGRNMRAVVAALGGESVDLVEHDVDQLVYARRALTPAKVDAAAVTSAERGVIDVACEPEQAQAARGRDGVNLRLASKLVGSKLRLTT